MNGSNTHPLSGVRRLVDPGVIGQLRLAWRLLRDPRVGGAKYLLPALLTLYVLSPVDSIPDFLIGFGQMDDVGIVVAGALMFAGLIPKLAPRIVVDEHLRDLGYGCRGQAEPGRPIDITFTVR